MHALFVKKKRKRIKQTIGHGGYEETIFSEDLGRGTK